MIKFIKRMLGIGIVQIPTAEARLIRELTLDVFNLNEKINGFHERIEKITIDVIMYEKRYDDRISDRNDYCNNQQQYNSESMN